MSGIFKLDAPIWVFMGEVADLIILSLLWWLGCIGIITIGTSTAAVYYVLGKKVRKENTYVARDFIKSYKQNFRQAAPLTMIPVIGFISVFLYLMFILQSAQSGETVKIASFLIPIACFVAFEVFSINTYMWGILSRFDMKSKALIKMTVIMVHKHLVATIVNLGIIAAVAVCCIKYPPVIVLAPGLIMGGQSFVLQKLFSRYIKIEKTPGKQEASEEMQDE